MGSVYHPGELAAQAKAGSRELAERRAAIVRTRVSAGMAAFLAEQRILVLGAADRSGRVWSSLLTGEPGFLRVPAGAGALEIAAHPLAGDPLAGVLADRAQVGAIALEPTGRRRLRINGSTTPTPDGLRLGVEQIYGNCPQYIQRRDPLGVAGRPKPSPPVVSDRLSSADRELVTGADTFFLATASATGSCDASHRGGNPGFVRVRAGSGEAGAGAQGDVLSWLDYPGNGMFMTLGNLEQNPAAGLLFVDWSSGTTLALTGRALVDWGGARPSVRLHVEQVRRTEGASPLRWGPPEYSRFNPPVPAR